MRLDKFVSNNTELSRSRVKRLVRSGAVEVNGETVIDAGAPVTAADSVLVEKAPVVPRQLVYFMLNKPVGYVCSHEDGNHASVLKLLQTLPPYSPPASELQIVGRLDLDTSGLLLISNDGQWNHRITSPRSACQKRYRVSLAEPLAERALEQFAHGIQLDSETRPTRPAKLEILSPTKALLTISEGRYHQVKRMFAATGNKVVALHREAVGAIELDVDLAPGEYRPLRPDEIRSVAQRRPGQPSHA